MYRDTAKTLRRDIYHHLVSSTKITGTTDDQFTIYDPEGGTLHIHFITNNPDFICVVFGKHYFYIVENLQRGYSFVGEDLFNRGKPRISCCCKRAYGCGNYE